MTSQKKVVAVGILSIAVMVALHCYVGAFNFLSSQNCAVDFDESMQAVHYPQRFKSPAEKQFYNAFKMSYQKNSPTITKVSGKKIPKIIHQIWLGSPFPEKYKIFRDSWLRHHPGWEYRLWTDADVAAFPLHNQAIYDSSSNYGEKSDIARYEILYKFGGLYVDTDFECLRALDNLHDTYDFYIGVQPLDTNIVQLGIGLIGTVPGHPLLRACINHMAENASHFVQVIQRTGPLYFTRVFEAIAPLLYDRTVALPSTYFYPKGYTQTEQPEAVWRRPESYAVHHWEGSWLKKEAQIPRK